MKIIFMGNSAIACPILNALNNSKHDLLAVVSNPPKQFGRGRSLSYTPVGQLAKELKLNFFPAESLNNEVLQDNISMLKADLFVVVAFRILPKSFLLLSKKGAINLHGSLLPQYRGAAPIQHALLNGDVLTGISTFLIDKNLDTGPIILLKKIPPILVRFECIRIQSFTILFLITLTFCSPSINWTFRNRVMYLHIHKTSAMSTPTISFTSIWVSFIVFKMRTLFTYFPPSFGFLLSSYNLRTF